MRNLRSVLFLCLGCLAWTAVGSNVRLTWDLSPDSSVTGYIVHWGITSGTYTNAMDVGNVATATIPNLVDGTTYYFVVTAYSNGGIESDPSNEVEFLAPDQQGGEPYVIGKNPGRLRNDFSGYVGMKLVVGTNPVSVVALGRIMAAGNSGSHRVKMVNGADGSDVPGGEATVTMAGGVVGQFQYAVLNAPVQLAPGATYYLVSEEFLGGDTWYDWDTTVGLSGVAANTGVVWRDAQGVWNPYDAPGHSFGPVNFKYKTSTGGGTTEQAYVTDQRLGRLRNDFSGYVGMKLVVGANPLNVVALGRIMAARNAGSHRVKLVNGTDGSDVPGGEATITMPGGIVGQFQYADLNAPVQLAAGATYYLVSQELVDGDTWYDWDTTVTVSGVAANTGVVWGHGEGVWNPYAAPGQSFGPVNFKYTTSTGGGTGTIEQAYVTDQQPGQLRNDYSGFVGMRLVVGANPLNVVALGRIMAAGNSGSHKVKLVNGADGTDVPGGQATVTMGGGTAGQFQYAALNAPVQLAAGATYYLVSEELLGGDTWYDWDTRVTVSGVAANPGIVWRNAQGVWNPYAAPGQSFGPVNFKYTTSTGGGTGTIEQAYVTDQQPGQLRNDYSGFVGMRLVVGANPLNVVALGRIMAAGNSGSHKVKLVNGADGTDVPGGQATVTMGGGTAGQFQYAALNAPVQLAAGATYYLVSEELLGGDTWYDWDTRVTVSGVAANPGIVWRNAQGVWNPYDAPGQSFGPVNFKYTTSTGGGTGTIEQAYVTDQQPGQLRNDYSGFVGMRLVVGANPLNVVALGRIMAAGNSGSHKVKLVNGADGTDVPGGQATVTMGGGTAGQFQYAALNAPVQLAAGATYYLVSEELLGGDTWYDWDTRVTVSGVAANPGIVWGYGQGLWFPYDAPGQSFGPVNFKYVTSTGGG